MNPIKMLGEKTKLINFLESEEGSADRRKVLATGAVLAGSALAQTLLVATPASAHCVDFGWNCDTLGSIFCARQGGSATWLGPNDCLCVC